MWITHNLGVLLIGATFLNYLNAASYEPIPVLDLTKYTGMWYEVYKDLSDEVFQLNGSCVTAEYALDGDKVKVINSEIYPNGTEGIITGYAFYQDDNSGGELSVLLDGVKNVAPYWVIDIGPIIDDQYSYSVVSDDKKLTLFVLVRNIEIFFEKYNKDVLDFLEESGFTKKINKPLVTDQTNCNYTYKD